LFSDVYVVAPVSRLILYQQKWTSILPISHLWYTDLTLTRLRHLTTCDMFVFSMQRQMKWVLHIME